MLKFSDEEELGPLYVFSCLLARPLFLLARAPGNVAGLKRFVLAKGRAGYCLGAESPGLVLFHHL